MVLQEEEDNNEPCLLDEESELIHIPTKEEVLEKAKEVANRLEHMELDGARG